MAGKPESLDHVDIFGCNAERTGRRIAARRGCRGAAARSAYRKGRRADRVGAANTDDRFFAVVHSSIFSMSSVVPKGFAMTGHPVSRRLDISNPDMSKTFTLGRRSSTRRASSRPSINGMTTSTSRRSMSPGWCLARRIALSGSSAKRTRYSEDSRMSRAKGPTLGSSSTTRIVRTRGAGGCLSLPGRRPAGVFLRKRKTGPSLSVRNTIARASTGHPWGGLRCSVTSEASSSRSRRRTLTPS